jgi:ribosomal protein S12 methylthiotransferase
VDESLDAIGEALAENGKVIVTGCLGAQPQRILDRHPQVLKITGPQRYEESCRRCTSTCRRSTSLSRPDPGAGHPADAAALRLPEDLRGLQSSLQLLHHPVDARRSGQPADRRGAARGRAAGARRRQGNPGDLAGHERLRRRPEVRGADWRGKARRAHFYDLAAALGELGVWIRLHYVYPYPHVDKVIELMASGRVLPYLDIPFQHASARILKLMKRPAAAENTLERIAAWRRQVPDITLRSTFIVGFPGETEQDFEELLDWLASRKLDRVGCFEYSPVEGAAANALREPQVPPEVKQERYQRFMELAAEISAAAAGAKVGRRMQVLVDRIEGAVASRARPAMRPKSTARCASMERTRHLKVGDWAEVRITAAGAYDLEGEA